MAFYAFIGTGQYRDDRKVLVRENWGMEKDLKMGI